MEILRLREAQEPWEKIIGQSLKTGKLAEDPFIQTQGISTFQAGKGTVTSQSLQMGYILFRIIGNFFVIESVCFLLERFPNLIG